MPKATPKTTPKATPPSMSERKVRTDIQPSGPHEERDAEDRGPPHGIDRKERDDRKRCGDRGMTRRIKMNRQRGFADVVAGLDVDELVAEYEHDRRVAPRRPERLKRCFVDGHDGIPASTKPTTRVEEHLALALFRLCDAGGRLIGPSGDRMRLIAYQVPLKARQTDAIGKIDLLGLCADGRVCLVELKAPLGIGDSPLRALIEALAYAAVLEANRASFEEELLARHPDATGSAPLNVVVLGPTSWSQAWENSRATRLSYRRVDDEPIAFASARRADDRFDLSETEDDEWKVGPSAPSF